MTAILDPFVTIGWAATVLPFASPYRTVAISLGSLAVDLAGAVLVTSLGRHGWASGPGGPCTGLPTWRGPPRFCTH